MNLSLRDRADNNIMFEATEHDVLPKMHEAKMFIGVIEGLISEKFGSEG